MLTVIGGLAVMLGSSPLAAQTAAASAVRSAPSTVAPSETFTVTITASNYGTGGLLTDTLPAGFEYVGSDDGGEQDGQDVEFLLINFPGGRGDGNVHLHCQGSRHGEFLSGASLVAS